MNPPNAEDQDARAMTRLMEGHDAALNDLMSRHAERLHHYLFRSLQNEEDAADLAQETFVKVYQHRTRYNPQQKFSTWLYAIASNLVRDRFRWRSRHPQVALEGEAPSRGERLDLPNDQSATPPEALQEEERAQAVRCAIADLPEELRQPLLLSEYEELPQAEIAQILGCTIKAVETRLYRARQKLRVALSDLLDPQ